MSDRESELDAANARVAEMERRFAGDKATFARLVSERDAANARADEAEHALQAALYRASDAESHCKALAEDRSALREEHRKALEAYDAEVIGRREEVTRCHSELGKLRAEEETWRVALAAEQSRRAVSESSLAEARALLGEMAHERSISPHWRGNVRAWLAANPESPRAVGARWRVGTKVPHNLYEGDEPRGMLLDPLVAADIVAAMNTRREAGYEPESPLAAAERALLDACASAIIYNDASLGLTLKEDYAICKAVLAWREAGK